MSEPEENQKELNEAYELGASAGLEQASGVVLERAMEAFLSKQPEATMLRGLSDKLKKLAEKRHPGTDSQYRRRINTWRS